ncbi:MAG TPA: hypothetical protein PLT34_07625, partial [Muribaculaceae bacterium]|nr:hypothetical protein [Muribaculaceae bacterium]
MKAYKALALCLIQPFSAYFFAISPTFTVTDLYDLRNSIVISFLLLKFQNRSAKAPVLETHSPHS